MELYQFSAITLFYWLAAFSVFEWIAIWVILLFSQNRFKTPIEYYRELPSWVTVSGDFIYSTVTLLTAQLIFRWIEPFVVKMAVPKLGAFIVLMILLQFIFDLIFAKSILSLPSNFSKYVEYFQRYIAEASFGAAISDSIWIFSWLIVTVLFMKFVPIHIAAIILSLSTFIWLVVKW